MPDMIRIVCSLVADKMRRQDISGAGEALSSALFVATMFGVLIQAVLLVRLSVRSQISH